MTKTTTTKSDTVWPVIIKRNFHDDAACYEYEYPRAIFNNIQFQNSIYVPFGLNRKKSDRLTFARLIINKHMAGEIDIFLYHFGMFLIYADYQSKDDLSEASIGKKRAQFVQTLPKSRFMSTDDFITAAWSSQIDFRDTDTREYRRNPYMEKVRILFDPDQLDSWTGTHYSNADWVEPISGRLDIECRKWTKEKDPMAPKEIPEGWVEGHIMLEDTESGYRHYVCGVPIHAGSAILSKLEDIIKATYKKGYKAFCELEEITVFQWISKIYYGLLFKELSLPKNRRTPNLEKIITPDVLKRFKALHIFLQSIRKKPINFIKFNPWSIFVFKMHINGDYTEFDYHDDLVDNTFSMQLGEIGIVACLGDNGVIQGQVKSISLIASNSCFP